ncbi:hypothetical protein V495_02040 [Pseudogymnoascus sp. VKM F-4514 (FW-929)]|nr:hypothetical protein V495_02040 [Pseudogymnoascus sp. VKM F-4514 (FW-929)]
MIARREYLAPTPAASEEPSQDESRKRVSARQTKAQHQARDATYRCLAWHNGMALEELGHLHSEQPRARRPTKKGAVAEEGGKGKRDRGRRER